MDKIIVCSFWVPDEIVEYVKNDCELIYPAEKITGHFSRNELLERAASADAVFIDLLPFTKEMIDAAGWRIKAIGRLGVGCDSVDCEYAGYRGIAVINTPNAVTQPTAELTVALILDAARNVTRLDRQTRQAGRCQLPDSFLTGSTTLFGKTLGIVGFGRIGTAVARKARGLGLKILYASPRRAPPDVEAELEAVYLPLEELLQQSDFVSLHCPYKPQNHHLINEKTLSMMKQSAFLVNASRGKVIDEAALVSALKNKTICGAALDVYEAEPEISAGLLELENVVLSPHIGTWSYDARIAMAKEALDGLCEWLNGGNPPNVFNKEFLRLRHQSC